MSLLRFNIYLCSLQVWQDQPPPAAEIAVSLQQGPLPVHAAAQEPLADPPVRNAAGVGGGSERLPACNASVRVCTDACDVHTFLV